MQLSKYNKFIVAGIGVAIAILLRHFGATNVWVQDAILVATAFGVYQVPNKI